jgi:preprotein translocase subunit YajC
MFTKMLLLQAVGGQSAQILNLLFIGSFILIFWLFMIRPQAKKAKEQKSFSDSLSKGDEVITGSGILGRITKIEGDVITIEVATKSYLRVIRSAISKELTEANYGAAKKNTPVTTEE